VSFFDGYLETVGEIERRAQQAGANLSNMVASHAPVGELETLPNKSN
jgi:hypothetical protein